MLVVTGDGSLLMSLGALVTVAGTGVTNLSVVLLDNGIYEVTGGQKTAATGLAIDYPGLAQAAGFASALDFNDLTDWQNQAAATLRRARPAVCASGSRAHPA